MIYMLFDNPADRYGMKFLYDYKTAEIEQVYPSKKCSGSIKEMIRVCNTLIKESKKNDTILCWYDFMGVLCWWICKMTRKKRNIIAINVLLKDKKTAKNRIAKFLYKIAFKSKQIQATVTSKEYGVWINKILHINEEYEVLHDIYHSEYDLKSDEKICNKTIFCGGRNGRNWKMVLEIANVLPDVKVRCIMPKDEYAKYKNCFPDNMEVQYDVSINKFMKTMCESELIIMPLDTEAPAGLIALFQAGANGKPLVVSDTVTTREYFSDDRGYLCKDDIEEWKKTIEYCLSNSQEAIERAKKFKKFLEQECTEKKYAEKIANMCEI